MTTKPEYQAFRILVMGDFSGRAKRGVCDPGSLAGRRVHAVDRDNIDEVMAKLGVAVSVAILGKGVPPATIRFSELDNFHPDRLFEQLELFEALRDIRRSLKDPAMFAVAGRPAPPSAPSKDVEEVVERIVGQPTTSLLDQVVDETQGGRPKAGRGTSELDVFLRRIVEPHLVPDISSQQTEMLASTDAAATELMRRVLHHPDFQAVEAAWRGVHFLVSRLETGEDIQLFLLDISRDELAADLRSTDDLITTGIYRLLVEQTVETPGAEPWAVLAGSFTFGGSRDDVELLGRMAKIAAASGAPFIVAASAEVLGCESLAKTPDPRDWKQAADAGGDRAWAALRSLPEARYLGLALPRFLLRLPYGADTEPVESFAFEEMEAAPVHEHYLWGNPALACACLLGQAFSEEGWDLRPGVIQDIEGLPLHVYKEQGGSVSKPCAEAALTERAAEIILVKGLMLLLSYKNQDRVRLARFQSVADPLAPLAGRWRNA